MKARHNFVKAFKILIEANPYRVPQNILSVLEWRRDDLGFLNFARNVLAIEEGIIGRQLIPSSIPPILAPLRSRSLPSECLCTRDMSKSFSRNLSRMFLEPDRTSSSSLMIMLTKRR